MRRTAESVEQQVGDFVRLCRESRMNVTPQRLAIYQTLLESDDHPSPESLYQRVRRGMPSVSLATIYKTLDALQYLGVIQEFTVLSESRRYDGNLDRHHHLVCLRCKQVSDFYDAGLDQVAPREDLGGFVPRAVSVQIIGLCAGCAQKPAES